MVVGAISSRTELAILGAGPGGYAAALRAADAGLEVTLIDRAEVGGTCLNVGCIPSKTLIEVASVRHAALTAGRHGLRASVDVELSGITAHMASVTRELRDGVQSLLSNAGVTVIAGDANIARYDRLSIAHQGHVSHLEFDNLIIATGSRPIELTAFPIDGERIVSSTGALALSELPRTMAVIGGGYIGIELGTAWSKLGVHVTVVEAAQSVLPSVPNELSDPVERRLSEIGVAVRTSCQAHLITPTGLLLDDGSTIDADIIVVAVGRRPNSDQASLTTLPIEVTQSGHIRVDNQMRACSAVYAVGDLVEGPALAHKATAQAETAVDAILGRPAHFSPAALPAVIFSDPEILTVGVGLDEAPTYGMSVHRFPHTASARARTIGSTTGATFLVVDEAGTIAGVHAVGPHVSELAGEAALAIEMAATIEDLALTIHAHPTMSESLAESAWLARGQPLHIRR